MKTNLKWVLTFTFIAALFAANIYQYRESKDLREEIEYTDRDASKLRRDVENLESELEDVTSRVDETESDIDDLESKVSNIRLYRSYYGDY